MLKQQYRSEMEVIADILRVTVDCGKQGVIITVISRRANLPYYKAIEKCQKLADFGLLESSIDKRNRTFSTTEKGLQFFLEIQKFIEKREDVQTSSLMVRN